MTKEQKYIHISDILTFYSGKTMSLFGQLTAPDGTITPKYDTTMQPVISVAEFITGKKLWIDKETKEYDGFALSDSVEDVRDSLVKQLPWLKDYKNPPKIGTLSSDDEKASILKEWVLAVAKKNGGEWFKLESEAAAKPAVKPKATVYHHKINLN